MFRKRIGLGDDHELVAAYCIRSRWPLDGPQVNIHFSIVCPRGGCVSWYIADIGVIVIVWYRRFWWRFSIDRYLIGNKWNISTFIILFSRLFNVNLKTTLLWEKNFLLWHTVLLLHLYYSPKRKLKGYSGQNKKLSYRWQTARCWFVKLLRYGRTFCHNT